jgi:hypothetical protein
MGKTFFDKLKISLRVALIFMVVSLPYTYKFTNNYINTTTNNCPTALGKLAHGIVFFVLNIAMMKYYNYQRPECDKKPFGVMLKYSYYGTLIAYLLADNDIYKLSNSVIGGVSDNNGCPTIKGVAIHSLVYSLVLTGVMYFPNHKPSTCDFE